MSVPVALFFLCFILVLLANTAWLGMALLNLVLDTTRETARESTRNTKTKIVASAVVEFLMLLVIGMVARIMGST